MDLDELIARLQRLRDDGADLVSYEAEPATRGQATIHLVVGISAEAVRRAVEGA